MVHVEYNLPDKVMQKIKEFQETGEFEEEKEVIIRAINNLYERSSDAYKEIEEEALELKKQGKTLRMHGESIEKEIKRFMSEVRLDMSRPDFGLCIVPDTKELYGQINQDLIWSFYNSFFPLKMILLFFLVSQNIKFENQKAGSKENVLMEDFVVELAEHTKDFVKVFSGEKFFEKLLIGFPTTKEKFLESPKVRKIRRKDKKIEKAGELEKTSMNRFISQFFGRVLAKKPNTPTRIAGACFEMKLFEAWETPNKMIEIRLTELGERFALLKSPMIELLGKGIELDIENNTVMKHITDEEREFILKEIISQFTLEENIVKKYLKEDRMSVDEIYKIFKDEQEWYLGVKNDKDREDLGLTERRMRIQSGTIMKRLEELRYFNREQNGRQVTYFRN